MRVFRARSQSGAAAIELVIVAPLLLLLMFGLFDIGNAIQEEIWLEQAVRAGGMLAISLPPPTAAAIVTAVQKASWSTVTANATLPTIRCTDGTSPPSGSVCPTGPTYQYVTITATIPVKQFKPFGLTILPDTLGASYVEQVP